MPLYIAIISGILLAGLFLLLKTEQVRGRRLILIKTRNRLDNKIEHQIKDSFRIKFLNNFSLRLLFHFLAHHILGITLVVTDFFHSKLHQLRRRNKALAKTVTNNTREKNHLHHIADHKESMTLSPEEQEVLKERSLND